MAMNSSKSGRNKTQALMLLYMASLPLVSAGVHRWCYEIRHSRSRTGHGMMLGVADVEAPDALPLDDCPADGKVASHRAAPSLKEAAKKAMLLGGVVTTLKQQEEPVELKEPTLARKALGLSAISRS